MIKCLILQAAIAAALVAMPAAAAGPRHRTMVFPAAADEPCGRISVEVIGTARPKTVLVLVPGYGAGAGLMTVAAANLVGSVKQLQVWLPQRREQNLIPGVRQDDRCSMATANVGAWGLETALDDLRRVVKAASRQGRRKVVLGGHSWGATEALLYAAWDFGRDAGYRDLAGLILIDGGVHNSFAGEGISYHVTPEEAEQRLDEITRAPIDATLSQLVGSTEPAAAGQFYTAAARLALAAPDTRSTLSEQLPDGLRPNGAVTNRALIGWLFDAGAPVPDVKLHLGHFRGDGVRDWVSSEPAVMNAFIAAAAKDHPSAWEYYWPKRLSLDLEAADGFTETSVTRLLGLRLTHTREIDVPLYAFETGLTSGSVLESARWVVGESRIRRAAFARDQAMTHLDPLFIASGHNRFIKTAAAFLNMVGLTPLAIGKSHRAKTLL